MGGLGGFGGSVWVMVSGSVDSELSEKIWFVSIQFSEERHKVKKWSGRVGSGGWWVNGQWVSGWWVSGSFRKCMVCMI